MKFAIATVILLVFGSSWALGQWRIAKVQSDADFRGLCVVSSEIAWVSGTQGTFGRTADGGNNWTFATVPDAEKLDFRDVKAFGQSTAYLLSAGPGDGSRIYKTTDAGKTWSLQFKNADPDGFYDGMAFWDEMNGIALGDPVRGQFQLIITHDGGAHWTRLTPKNIPPALANEGAFAASGSCIVAVGGNDVWFGTGGGKVARLFHSMDRGQHWSAIGTPVIAGVESAGIFSIAFRDAKHGIIVGGDYRQADQAATNMAITSDGGTSWRAVANSLPYRSCVAWGKDRWVAVGTTGSDYSLDLGVTWKSLDRGKYNSVRFADTGDGWAVGPKGLIAKFTR